MKAVEAEGWIRLPEGPARHPTTAAPQPRYIRLANAHFAAIDISKEHCWRNLN